MAAPEAGGVEALDEEATKGLIEATAHAVGFSPIGVSGIDLSSAEPGFLAWLAAGFAGSMDYLHRHGLKRLRPAELVPGTVSVLTVRLDYLPPADEGSEPGAEPADWREREWAHLTDPALGVISVYARGRDYHKVLRGRLQQLVERLQVALGPFGARVFTDSAPVAEAELAVRSGLGWRGKHTLVLHREAGSMFFLGEVYLSLPLTPTPPTTDHCGACTACLDACPTQAIVEPYRLDARRCISYLTIEHEGPIPEPLRAPMGNRVYGCDDCQLVCPWNKFARSSPVADFAERPPLKPAALLDFWAWTEADFLRHTEGTAIRRIGHARWRRNLTVAMGNALRQPPGALNHETRAALRDALRSALDGLQQEGAEDRTEVLRWALAEDPTA